METLDRDRLRPRGSDGDATTYASPQLANSGNGADDYRTIAQDAREQRRARQVRQDGAVQALGWFSIALGAAEIVMPRAVARAAGAPLPAAIVRTFGAREIAAGVGLLTQPRPAGWMWGRVAGDALDLAALTGSLVSSRAARGRVLLTMGAIAAITAADVNAARRLERRQASLPGEVRRDGSVRVEHSVTINRPVAECYRRWRDVERLPDFMSHLQSVERIDDRRSRWTAKAPAGMRVEWEAEITHDEPNAWIAWRSLPGADIENAGAVRFVPSRGGGTVVSVAMRYTPPLRTVGKLVGKMFGEEPEQQVREDLRRFKRLLETGEIPTTQGQPAGRRSALFRMLAKVNPA